MTAGSKWCSMHNHNLDYHSVVLRHILLICIIWSHNACMHVHALYNSTLNMSIVHTFNNMHVTCSTACSLVPRHSQSFNNVACRKPHVVVLIHKKNIRGEIFFFSTDELETEYRIMYFMSGILRSCSQWILADWLVHFVRELVDHPWSSETSSPHDTKHEHNKEWDHRSWTYYSVFWVGGGGGVFITPLGPLPWDRYE